MKLFQTSRRHNKKNKILSSSYTPIVSDNTVSVLPLWKNVSVNEK